MLHSAFKSGESLAMRSNSIYFPKKENRKNTSPPHFLSKTPLFTGVSESEVFAKHLTQQVTFSPRTLVFIRFLEMVYSGKNRCIIK